MIGIRELQNKKPEENSSVFLSHYAAQVAPMIISNMNNTTISANDGPYPLPTGYP